MASMTERRFTDEFKREAVALWETSGRPQIEVAAELGIVPTMLRRWQRKLQGRNVLTSPAVKRQQRPWRRRRTKRRKLRGCGASWTGQGWSATS